MKFRNMKLTNYLLLAVSLVLVMGCSTDETQTFIKFKNLTMEDNFNADGAPDPSIWTYDIGTGFNGWGNNELQYYAGPGLRGER